jgi:hypothetical protein
MILGRSVALLMLTGALGLGTLDARAQTPLDSPALQADQATEAQLRRQYAESQRLFARTLPDDVHQMIEREGKRARRAFSFVIITCLMLFLVFALPLSERDKEVDAGSPGPGNPQSF